jgi:hypothetical protein
MPHKYNAIRTWTGGHWFASKREARRYTELLLLESAGEIKGIELQPTYRLMTLTPDGALVSTAKYIADFRYVEIPSDRGRGRERCTDWGLQAEETLGGGPVRHHDPGGISGQRRWLFHRVIHIKF